MISIFLMISLFGALSEKSTNEIIMAELVKKFINQVLIKLKAIKHLTAFNQEEVL